MPRSSWQHLYETTRWRKLRLIHLGASPLCRMCADQGRIVPARVVDHIKPHRGDETLFWDSSNLQSLCAPCHDTHKQRQENGKATPPIGLDGWPVEGFVDTPHVSVKDAAHPPNLKPLALPLTIVCGPPASGKSTYVATHRAERDIVLDLDTIAIRRFGRPAPMLGTHQRQACLEARNDTLTRLASPAEAAQHDRAWLIVAEPTLERRQWWQDKLKPESIVIIETPKAECIARYRADKRQQRPADTPQRINEWWFRYRRRAGETVITP